MSVRVCVCVCVKNGTMLCSTLPGEGGERGEGGEGGVCVSVGNWG